MSRTTRMWRATAPVKALELVLDEQGKVVGQAMTDAEQGEPVEIVVQGESALMIAARAAAGPFEPSNQREGRPLFEDDRYTICPVCTTLKRVENCFWSEDEAFQAQNGVRKVWAEGKITFLPLLPGTCKPCALEVRQPPAPEPERKAPARKAATSTAFPAITGWRLFREDINDPGSSEYRCKVCEYAIFKSTLDAMVGPKECWRCTQQMGRAVADRGELIDVTSEDLPNRAFVLGRAYQDGQGWASLGDRPERTRKQPRKSKEPQPEPTLRRKGRMITLPDD